MAAPVSKFPKNFPFCDDEEGYEPPKLISYDYTIPGGDLKYETDDFDAFIKEKKKEEEEKAKAKTATPPPQPIKIEVVQHEPSPVFRHNSATAHAGNRFSQDYATSPFARTPSPTPPESSPWANPAFIHKFWMCQTVQDITMLFAQFLLDMHCIPVWDSEEYKRIYGVNRNDNRVRILSALFTKSIYMNPLNASYDWKYSVFQHSVLGADPMQYVNPLHVGQSAKHSGIYEMQTLSQSSTQTHVYFTKLDYFAAIKWANDHIGQSKFTILNMGNPTSPGAGWDLGYEGLEADIFMRTNISSSLSNYLYPIGMYESIYTPDVTLIRAGQDEGYRFIKDKEMVSFDVVTASAVDCRGMNMGFQQNWKQLYDITCNKALNILDNCKKNKSRILILGAFGCGYFENPPALVAQAFNAAIQNYRGCFDYVFFSILNPNVYGPFYQAFAQASTQNFNPTVIHQL